MSNLKEAISYIYDIEKNNYFMTRAIQEIDEELEIPKPEAEPVLVCPKRPVEPTRTEAKYDKKSGAKSAIIGYIIAAFLIGVVFAVVAIIMSQNNPDALKSKAFTICLDLVCIIPVACIFIIIRKKKSNVKKDNNAYNKQYERDMAQYRKELEKYHKDRGLYEKHVKSINADCDKKYRNKQAALKAMRKVISDKLAESKAVAKLGYEKVGIDSTYRNLIPIGYMNEFIRLGISNKLEGADGLYYLVRQELRMDDLSHKLDYIVQKLDTLINNQHMLYSELIAMNQKCDNLISATMRQTDALLAQNNLISNQNALMEKIQSDTQIAAYNSDRMAREQEFMNYFQRYARW
ncbi:MAG: hypothetical protein IKU23_08435 [Clostridia bacterium]|nr:hypothetical protein [Clostridia bacterium]